MKRKLRAMRHGAGTEEERCGAASDPGPGKTARRSLAARDETQACGPGSHVRINRKLPYPSVLKALGCLDELPPSLEEEACTEPGC